VRDSTLQITSFNGNISGQKLLLHMQVGNLSQRVDQRQCAVILPRKHKGFGLGQQLRRSDLELAIPGTIALRRCAGDSYFSNCAISTDFGSGWRYIEGDCKPPCDADGFCESDRLWHGWSLFSFADKCP